MLTFFLFCGLTWNVQAQNPELFPQLGHLSYVNSVGFSPDGRRVISGSEDSTLKLWDTATGCEIRTFWGHTRGLAVTSVSFSPDGLQVLSGCQDKIVKLWDAATGSEIRTFSGHSDTVRFVSFSPDGRRILSGSYDSTVRIWDVATGKEIAQFVGFTDGEWIVMSPEGYYNASPNGARYFNIRVGDNVHSIDQYRETYYKPELVAQALSGG